ncbi:unnamed protein product [Microthlaspi erraticum]|uniref:Prolamin-like domain-containing protein n=1 Tax=Microthlaspi erraticum TaxID=1685480 RepID=A0A6D2J659_9BRAS|nr:unnamed protein product [Microthlaspi erraticum]
MNQKQTKVIFFLLALISASMFRQSEAAKLAFCPIAELEKVAGCHDSLKLAADRDYRWLRNDCCVLVHSFFLKDPQCQIAILPGRAADDSLPVIVFEDICTGLGRTY